MKSREDEKVNNTRQSGGKTYLFSIIFNIAVQICFTFVVLAVMASCGYESTDSIPGYSTWNLVAMFLLQVAFVAAVVYTRPALSPVPKIEAGEWAKQILFAVLSAAVCLCCFSWLGEWFAVFLDYIGYRLSDITMNGAADIILAVIVTVIIAPMAEETVFRNALIGDIKKRHGFAGTVALSGLCFALMHMNPQQTVYQFFLGCTCAYAFIKTGNIVCPVVIHALNNGCAIALSFAEIPLITPPEGQISVLTGNAALSVPVTLLLAAAGMCIIYYAGKKLFKKTDGGYFLGTEKSGGKAPCAVAMSVCAFMWICNFIGSMG